MGASPSVTDHVEPTLAADQVLIEVRVATVNAIDRHIAMGRYRDGPPRTPYVPQQALAGRLAVENDVVPLDAIGEAWDGQRPSGRKLVIAI